ncbi:MAG: energy transducer TonB [Azonexus sp.]
MRRMCALPAPPSPRQPEWQHSGPYLLLAVLLHASLLFYPVSRAGLPRDLPAAGPVFVQLATPPVPARPVAPPPSTPAPPARSQPGPPRPAPAPTSRPVIALPAEAPTAPAAFSVPVAPPLPAPAAASGVSASVAAPVSASVSAARFDAAYLQNPRPNYPALSRRLGEEGKVLLKVRVTAEGTAAAVELEKSSGFDRLDTAARETVARWRFVPAKRGDEAIESAVIVPIIFRLDD